MKNNLVESPFPYVHVDQTDLEFLKSKYEAEAVMIVLCYGDKCYHRGLNFDGKRVGVTHSYSEDEIDETDSQ